MHLHCVHVYNIHEYAATSVHFFSEILKMIMTQPPIIDITLFILHFVVKTIKMLIQISARFLTIYHVTEENYITTSGPYL